MAEAIVEHDYSAKQPDELTIKKGDIIKEVVKKQDGWCEGLLDGKRGLFPDNFVIFVQVNMRTNSSNLRKCKVVYSYKQEHEDELTLNIGDVIEIVGEEEEGWWKGRLNGKIGVFPSNFVEEMKSGTIKENDDLTLPEDKATLAEDIPKAKEEIIPSKIYCEVKYAYTAQNLDELTLKEGDIVTLISKDGQDAGWWRGELDGKVGVFPDNFVVIIEKPELENQEKKQTTNVANNTKHVAMQRRSQEIKALKIDTTTTSSTTNTNSTTAASPPVISHKKPTIPFKKSPSASGGGLFSSISGLTKKLADTIDGGASSKSVKLVNDIEHSNKENIESYHAFDQVERNPILQDPRATRVKAPGRRPPSVALKEGEVVINGNSDYGSLEDANLEQETAPAQTEIKPRSLECQKPPWLDEMSKKMNNKRTTPPPPEKKLDSSTNSIDDNKSEGSPIDMTKSLPPTMFSQQKKMSVEKPDVKLPKTPPNELERVSTNHVEKIEKASGDKEKVAMRLKPSVNVRPQSIEAPNKPVAKTSPTIHKSPSPSPKPPIADRSSLEVINSRHFNELNERIATLEAEVKSQRAEFQTAYVELAKRLQVETDLRMQLQLELEKLQTQMGK